MDILGPGVPTNCLCRILNRRKQLSVPVLLNAEGLSMEEEAAHALQQRRSLQETPPRGD